MAIGKDNRPARGKRPFFVWVVILGMLAFMIFNAARLYGALRYWDTLKAMGVQPGVWYIAVTGGVFAAAFLVAFLFLLFRLPGAAWTVTAVVFAYILWYWLDRLLLARNPVVNANAAFAVGATVVLGGFSLLAVWTAEHSN